MKKCPTCDKTFEDSMKFCQVDGTPLVEDAPAFDPYATMVAGSKDLARAEPAAEEAPTEPTFEPQPEEPVAIAPPDDILDLPEADPLKTMYVSEAELKEVMGGSEKPKEEPAAPEPPSFTVPEVPAPSFSDVAPPPSPFSTPEAAPEPSFNESETMIQPPAFDVPPPVPAAEWTPPPAPDAAWQNQQIDSNTPFQPPVVGDAKPSSILAIISLVAGILGCLTVFGQIIPLLGWVCLLGPFPFGVTAAITGFLARSRAVSSPDQYGGKGAATAGIVLGAIGILLQILMVVFIFVLMGGMAVFGGK